MSCINIPIVRFDACNPVILPGEIVALYVAGINAADFTDWTDSVEFLSRVNNALPNDADVLRKLTVIGDMPLPTAVEKEISGGRLSEVRTLRVINIEMDEATPENYEFIVATETSTGLHCKVWIETMAGVRFGSNSGITGRLKIRPVLTRGSGEIEKYIGTFKWNSLTSPGRIDVVNADLYNLITDGLDDVLTDENDLIFT